MWPMRTLVKSGKTFISLGQSHLVCYIDYIDNIVLNTLLQREREGGGRERERGRKRERGRGGRRERGG